MGKIKMNTNLNSAPTPYDELNGVLAKMCSELQSCLADLVHGIYLQGSFALGDFDEHSDVDFIVAICSELNHSQVSELNVIHNDLFHLGPEWAKHLEGSYVPLDVLTSMKRRKEELWYLDHGSTMLERSTHCNTAIVRWVLRNRGIALVGSELKNLIPPIAESDLRQEMYETMHNWGKEILLKPEVYANRFYQAFIVLNYCRMLHDLVRGRPGSKKEGAKWAEQALDPVYKRLIKEAWSGRPDPASKVRQQADSKAYEKTLEFLQYVLLKSNELDSLG